MLSNQPRLPAIKKNWSCTKQMYAEHYNNLMKKTSQFILWSFFLSAIPTSWVSCRIVLLIMLISDHESTVTLVLTKESQPWKGDSGFQTDWKHWIYKVKVPSQLLPFKRISVFNRMVPIPPTWTILTAWESNFTLNSQ